MKKIILMMFILVTTLFAEIKTELVASKLEKNGERTAITTGNKDDVIVYTLTIQNDDDDIMKDVGPIIPIPEKTTIVSEKISPVNFKVSVDGEKFFAYPMKDEKGNLIPESDYRAVSWNVAEIQKNQKLIFEAVTKID